MLTEIQKRMYIEQFRQLQHAVIDDELVFVEVRRKRDGKDVLIGCIQRHVQLPPVVLGGAPENVVQTVPVVEFVDLGDGTAAVDNPYEPPDASFVEITDPVIATGADVIRQADALS